MTYIVVRSGRVKLRELDESALDELADLVLIHQAGAAIPVAYSRPVKGSTHREVRASLKAMAEDDSLGFIPPAWEITFVARTDGRALLILPTLITAPARTRADEAARSS